MVIADVAGMQESELQMTTQKLEESQKVNKSLKRENKKLKLMIEQLTTQLDEKNKLFVTKDEKTQLLRRDLQACKAGGMRVERQHAEFNVFNGLDSVSILHLFLNCNRYL